MRLKFKYPRVVGILFSVLLFFGGLELMLRAFDTAGTAKMVFDVNALAQHYQPDARDYSLPPGVYYLSDWSVTVDDNRTRQVPDTNPNGSKTLVFIGDSMTFAPGVNDDQTWVNLLAREFPDVHMINAGVSGYNSAQALRSIDVYPDADAYIWLTIHNDLGEPEAILGSGRNITMTYIGAYLMMLNKNAETAREGSPRQQGESDASFSLRTLGTEHYFADVDPVIEFEPRLTMVTFDDEFGAVLHERYDTIVIPWYTQRISAADGHPNAEGNREIAAAMQPIIAEIIQNLP